MTEPESSSSGPKGAYNVFLSFRGKDTRKNFTDHLYTSLVQAGIHTFRDDNELPRGEEISTHLLMAVQESKISLVVFSKGYASSRWCLNELVEILECKNRNNNQIVLPIFYDIDPSDVRKQTGSFAEAFDKHEECFKEKVKEWRNALEEAGNLSGWNLNDMANGHESKFIQEIIKDVLNKLDPKYFTVGMHLVGINLLVQNIDTFLSATTNDVRVVGIHGMAGIGKTTIAKAVFNKLCSRFHGSCFLFNVKETSEQPNGLVLLQEQLLHDVLKQNTDKIYNVERGMALIKRRLRDIRVLVVLDDVVHLNQLNALMGENSWFRPGSRVIITTQDKRLLLRVDRTYHVEELKRDESLQLFSWHAFGNIHPAQDFVELSNVVVHYCGGLPLALEILGCCLSKKNKARWKAVIEKLRITPKPDIQKKLRISFDTLDDDNMQNIFLDIACFFIGKEKKYAAEILEARCGFSTEDDLEILIERSLIKIGTLGMIAMHDLLRDMGREIIREKSPKNPGKWSRIWNHEDAWSVLNKQMGTKAIEGLKLEVRALEVKTMSTESFTKMKLLQLLQINGLQLTGCFKLLSNELIWLCWLECPLKSLPTDFTLDNLIVLDMQHSNITELWKETQILNKLKILDLSYSRHLAKTPNLHSSSLEKLILEGCLSLYEVHESVAHLKSLVSLNLKECLRLKTLPESICDVKSLETLNISGCSQLEKLPVCMGDMESLYELRADGIENEQLISSIVHLKNVRKLSLRGYNCKQDSPSDTSRLSLRGLNLNKEVFTTTFFTGWKSLRELNMGYNGFSEDAFNCVDFGSLSSLEDLNLSGNKFFNLPCGIGRLPKLKLLNVEHCQNLVSISELPSSLEEFYAYHSPSLDRLRLPIQSKTPPLLYMDGLQKLSEIQVMEDVDNGWGIYFNNNLPRNYDMSFVEAFCNGSYGYEINFSGGTIADWFDHHGEGCSLSFHIPPVPIHGLVVWVVCSLRRYKSVITNGWVTIRNKSNGTVPLFECFIAGLFIAMHTMSWVIYVRLGEKEMEEYSGEELELHVRIKQNTEYVKVKECGVHMILEMPFSLEESEWDQDISINRQAKADALLSVTDLGQWKKYLLKELPRWRIWSMVKFCKGTLQSQWRHWL